RGGTAARADSASWFDPAAGVATSGEQRGAAAPDIGEQQDSAPVSSGVHFLIDAVMPVVIAGAGYAAFGQFRGRPANRFPRVLSPPPRTALAAV
nr:hypothetical protein [Chloroflexia bacterium]